MENPGDEAAVTDEPDPDGLVQDSGESQIYTTDEQNSQLSGELGVLVSVVLTT